MVQPLYAFWCRYPSNANFGDALTPWLIHKITGEYPVFAWTREPVQKYLCVGSIVQFAAENCLVWGAGIISRNDVISSKATLLAVRGPITRQRALECGAVCPEIYGDPALLLPRFYQPRIFDRRTLIGVIPHYFDKPKVSSRWTPSPDLKFIDIQQRVERVIDQIVSCQFIVSSSLHGLIVANAYGLPALWVEFSTTLLGDRSKFHDYFHAVGQEIDEPIQLDDNLIEPDRLMKYMPKLPQLIDLNPLWKACPFRKP